ncbi:MAG: hypothetical protein FWD70_00670 [Desulfuromonadales bacterium]|nr:hypothetical protein [Desulfuromonadales bacterium]
MKFIIGTVITFIILVILADITLFIWGLKLISTDNLQKSLITFCVTLVFSPILTAIIALFFKVSKKREDIKVNVVQPKE